MTKPKPRGIPDVQAADPIAAFDKLAAFTRRILAVPKREIDARLAREKSAKRRAK
ncbi:MAG: hypothetical protein ABSC42_05515 [Tepidisphaeraceae bacterium]|jgi:hypothetical protein